MFTVTLSLTLIQTPNSIGIYEFEGGGRDVQPQFIAFQNCCVGPWPNRLFSWFVYD